MKCGYLKKYIVLDIQYYVQASKYGMDMDMDMNLNLNTKHALAIFTRQG